uniref:Putative secreted protein n=1 Tax=Anopheles marajoara TaxID=58244 RepID=A0A2M4C8U1_9DIPT
MFHFSLSLALYIFYSFACAPHSSCCGGSKCNCISVDGVMQVRPSHTHKNFKSSRPCSGLSGLYPISLSLTGSVCLRAHIHVLWPISMLMIPLNRTFYPFYLSLSPSLFWSHQ